MCSYDDKFWYDASQTRKRAEAELLEQGSFVVRPSSRPMCLSLSHFNDGAVQHALIHFEDGVCYLEGDEDEYVSVAHLLSSLHLDFGGNEAALREEIEQIDWQITLGKFKLKHPSEEGGAEPPPARRVFSEESVTAPSAEPPLAKALSGPLLPPKPSEELLFRSGMSLRQSRPANPSVEATKRASAGGRRHSTRSNLPMKLTRAEIRAKLIGEIISTERDYLMDLHVLLDVFAQPLLGPRSVARVDAKSLFANLEMLLTVNERILGLFDESVREAGGTPECVGGVFLQMADYLKLYTEYCANQPVATAAMQHYRDTNSSFTAFLREAEADPRCRGLNLAAFLIKPVQRLCKYPLFLRELVKYTPPEHADRAEVEKAAARVSEVVNEVNERKREAEGTILMRQTLEKIEDVPDSVDLVTASRRFVSQRAVHMLGKPKGRHVQRMLKHSMHETRRLSKLVTRPSQQALSGDAIREARERAQRKPIEHELFLFNDLLVWTTERKSGKYYKYRGSMPLKSMHMQLQPDGAYAYKGAAWHAVRLSDDSDSDGDVCDLLFAQDAERQRFLQELRTTQQNRNSITKAVGRLALTSSGRRKKAAAKAQPQVPAKDAAAAAAVPPESPTSSTASERSNTASSAASGGSSSRTASTATPSTSRTASTTTPASSTASSRANTAN